MRSSFAVGSWKNLKSQWRAYFIFNFYFNLEPFNPSSDILCVFAQFLLRTLNSYATIQNYISAIKTLFRLFDLSVDIFQDIQIKLTLKGIQKNIVSPPREAVPVDVDILSGVFRVINVYNVVDVT